jgi:uncharacterized protein YbjT (DUF2867 family)
MYVIAGVTGNTGGRAAEALLALGEKVRVVVRDAAKGEAWRARGAEVAVARLDDAKALAQALQGAQGAWLLVPPRYDVDDQLAANRPLIAALAKAVNSSGLPHVVFLSSVGADQAAGTGLIRNLHHAEEVLGAAAKHVTFLRAGYFFENFAPGLPATAGGALPTFLMPDRPFPMVATADIGRTAAELLLEPATGRRVVELSSVRAWSPSAVAAELSSLLGRTVVAQFVPKEAVVPALTGMGFLPGVAALFEEMHTACNEGRVKFGTPGAVRRLGQLGAGHVLGPLLERAATHA